MKPIISVGNAHVYDEVLSPETLYQLWNFMNILPYSRTDARIWTKVWGLADGPILRGPQWEAMGPSWALVAPPRQEQGQQFPTNPEPLVVLLKKVRQICENDGAISEIKKIEMLPYVWPPKSSISWHNDGTLSDPKRVGAFTFYAHKEWNVEWGGEFLLSQVTGVDTYPPFDNSIVSDSILSVGHGTWVSPKPNRLLMNPSDMLHKVTKTTEGAAPRLSIQGFLYTE